MDAYKFATAKLCGRREKPELVKVEEKQIVLPKETNKPLDEQTQKIDSTINAFEQKYHVHELIRNSANGVVYGALDKTKSYQPVVMKQITKKPKIHKNGFPPKEISFHTIATRVAPENVAQLYEWYERHNTYVMVMERPTHSIDLFELSKKYGALDESSVKRIMYQLVTTVLKLRTAGIVHHDIKDENILINMETFQIKLIDFGCAKNYSTDVQKRFSGTPEFFPPEWFHSKRYEQDKMTVWQMGCLFYILLTGKPPFRAAKDIQSAEWVAHRPILRHLRRYTYSLLVSMLAPSHEDRVGIEDILKHPYWTT